MDQIECPRNYLFVLEGSITFAGWTLQHQGFQGYPSHLSAPCIAVNQVQIEHYERRHLPELAFSPL